MDGSQGGGFVCCFDPWCEINVESSLVDPVAAEEEHKDEPDWWLGNEHARAPS